MNPLETGGLVSALQGLDVKPELIEQVVKDLTETGSDLEGALDQAQIGAAEFGNRPSAATLGLHYNKAYEVMQATIDGIAADLVAFGQTARTAAAYVDDADATSAADLSAARAAVNDLGTMSQSSRGDTNYDDARNGRTPEAPGRSTTPTTTQGGA